MKLWQKVYQELSNILEINLPTLKRVSLLVVGIILAKHGGPARIAQALYERGIGEAMAESIERRLRRVENDKAITAESCLHPCAREFLQWGKAKELLLIMDATTQEDKVVMLAASVWYRGRALPLAWQLWPGNKPLEGDGFWERTAAILDTVATILPRNIVVTWVADRAFGTPVFTDLVTAYGWHYIVRVQGQTRCRDRQGRERAISELLSFPRRRLKLRGEVFKKQGWRSASVVILWGRRHRSPLYLVSDLPPDWRLIYLYRLRFAIEASFRDLKSLGWLWEQGQVSDLEHLQRLLVGMALATWITVMAGAHQADHLLATPSSGARRTRPWSGKFSLFQLGLHFLHRFMHSPYLQFSWVLGHWSAPNWSTQIYAHHARAFVFSGGHR